MRRVVAVGAFLLIMLAGGSAQAEGFKSLAAGVNGIATFLADPVIQAIEGPEEYEDEPYPKVLGPFYGFLAGTAKGFYRLIGGIYDVVLFPLWVAPTLSPPPRFDIIPGIEIEGRE